MHMYRYACARCACALELYIESIECTGEPSLLGYMNFTRDTWRDLGGS